ncbi:Phosphatidylinositide phosphatase SAC2 [Psilocybe cubensis]|uniref:Phosphatidylinositide phosphatase SAC2 n=1 Tax=Psilocybe cubensis TaxID=181762 RepID=A0ACB8HA89_PSICU|nr:Phosphatidylinositide phosphatase SAC2 [Psilocybe cubensis]KAH9484391.1 Phosphatidylinositide phosphatase SAC2 [Psilocybe cubensis]
MKRFFERASKPFSLPNASKANDAAETASAPAPAPATAATSASTGPSAKLPSSNHANLPGTTGTTGLHPRYTLPAVAHPCPHSHLALLATKDGLLIRPHVKGQATIAQSAYIKISWGKTIRIEEIETVVGDGAEETVDWKDGVVVYGIVGILELYSCSYLLVITSRTEVGHIIDPRHEVYGVKGVTDIPLVEDRAKMALNTLAARNVALTRPSLIPRRQGTDVSVDVDDDQNSKPDPESSTKPSPRVQFLSNPAIKFLTPKALSSTNLDAGNSIARPSSAQSTVSDISTPSSEASVATSPVIKTLASRLSFWSRLSKRTNSPIDANFPPIEPMSLTEEQEVLDNLMQDGKEEPAAVIESILSSTAPPPVTTEERHSELETKVIRETIREFTKGDMYFAYTFDLTRSLQHKQEQFLKAQKQHDLLAGLGALPSPENQSHVPLSPMDGKFLALVEPYPSLPLWRRVDKQFWWNEWMSKPFIDAGLHTYVLPIMQGYCQVTKFNIPSSPVTVEEDVDVDYILVSRRSRYRPGLRYQRRGIDEGAHVANFVETETIMRVDTVVNLAEQAGKEGAITQAYRNYMHELNLKEATYCEYDFHTETKGMKYENISTLIESMERTFESQGYFWVSDNVVFSQQKGVFRVNCIDCLDRTNVVQSAFARYMLNKQLGAVALLNPSNSGRTDADLAFNDVWANNGDAISRAYAGTSALKGDFTRTGKRDLTGMLNDGVNSLARMYTSTFSDWFSQAVIDFMLGNRTTSVFSEFLLQLKSTDPRDLIRLSKIRAEAIATSVSRVLPEGERLLSGWTLFSPEELNTKVGMKFEEKVLLLSVKALYIVSYDYTLEKVKLYTRVPLGDIISITKGAYILSPLEESSCDPEQNAGFVVTWLSSNQESRVTSYSVRNSLDFSNRNGPPSPLGPPSPSSPGFPLGNKPARGRSNTMPTASLSNILTGNVSFSTAGASGTVNFGAFKVLPIDPGRVRRHSSYGSEASDGGGGMSDEMRGAATCREAVDLIVERIERACGDVGGAQGKNFIVLEDVVSLAEAQRMTSVYAKMEYGVKRLLWLGG